MLHATKHTHVATYSLQTVIKCCMQQATNCTHMLYVHSDRATLLYATYKQQIALAKEHVNSRYSMHYNNTINQQKTTATNCTHIAKANSRKSCCIKQATQAVEKNIWSRLSKSHVLVESNTCRRPSLWGCSGTQSADEPNHGV